ncbi:MAG: S8 family serine peptidase [Bacteroidales bacterium]
MRHYFTLLFFALFTLGSFTLNANPAGQEIITPQLNEKIQSVNPGEFIRINITLRDKFDSQRLITEVRSMSKEERRAHVISVLKDFSSLSQEGVVAELNNLERSARVSAVKTFWIANVINCMATPEAIADLAKRSDIASIDHDEYRIVLDPRENENAFFVEGVPGSREITWNVLKINADEVWALGLNGEGIIVSVIDTGVNYDHQDLQDHVWESTEYPNHGYDFINNDNDPMDDNGHGTHCAGTVAGDGTAGSQTGVAPEATIMCCKVLDGGGGGNESAVWSAVEFSLEQGAHVLSLSLGWQHSWGPNRTVWRQTFDNVLAAGIIASVAAGNEGDQQFSYPIPDNVRTPGDVPPPWLHPDQTLTGGISGVICVGSTTSSDQVSGFSSRGPLDWSDISPYNDYAYDPDMGLIRPDISAPGSNIKSLAHYSNTGYEDGWSGTSMATPANAGMIALMLQKNPNLTPEDISRIVEETAEVLQAGKNNNSGSGRIDALAAVEATSPPGPTYYSHIINDEAGNGDGFVDPGESILLTLAMANFSDEPAENVMVNLATDSEYITISDSTEFFGNFSLEDIIEMEDAFAFDAANNIPGNEMIEFFVNAYNDDQTWESSFTITAHGVTLELGEFSILDSSGNNNGSLDPGETADIVIETLNSGQLDALASMAYLSSTSSFITINTASFDLEDILAGGSATAVFSVEVDQLTPVGTSLDLDFSVESGDYLLEHTFHPKVGLIVEDFETGDFSQFEWDFAGNADWTIVNTGAWEGTYAAKSGVIGNSQATELQITLEVANDDSIAFYRKVSSEADYDFLMFYIDNEKMDEWAGNVDWGRASFPVSAGEHTFRWRYEKDVYVTGGDDCAWVDYIELPAMVDETMTVYAGDDDQICEGLQFQTAASAQNYISLLWETSGTGTFDDTTSMTAMYTPSTDDWEYGMVTLSLTGIDLSGNALTDDMDLVFMPMPAYPGEISGPEEVCQGSAESYTINALETADYYNWELIPTEAGAYLSNDTVVTVSFSEDYTGQAVLKVQGVNDCGAGEISEELFIQIEDCTSVGEIDQSAFMEINPNPAGEFVTISFPEQMTDAVVSIMDLSGKTLIEERVMDNYTTMDISNLNNGVYLISVKNDQFRMIEKLIIRN